MRSIRLGCAFLSILFFVASHVLAADLICGSNIISLGDRQYDVRRKCGNPTHVESWEELRVKRDLGVHFFPPGEEPPGAPLFVKVLVTVEEWEYNLGPGKFIRYLTFENGRLTKITTGDYGYY